MNSRRRARLRCARNIRARRDRPLRREDRRSPRAHPRRSAPRGGTRWHESAADDYAVPAQSRPATRKPPRPSTVGRRRTSRPPRLRCKRPGGRGRGRLRGRPEYEIQESSSLCKSTDSPRNMTKTALKTGSCPINARWGSPSTLSCCRPHVKSPRRPAAPRQVFDAQQRTDAQQTRSRHGIGSVSIKRARAAADVMADVRSRRHDRKA